MMFLLIFFVIMVARHTFGFHIHPTRVPPSANAFINNIQVQMSSTAVKSPKYFLHSPLKRRLDVIRTPTSLQTLYSSSSPEAGGLKKKRIVNPLRPVLKGITGFSLTALRQTLRTLTGLSLSKVRRYFDARDAKSFRNVKYGSQKNEANKPQPSPLIPPPPPHSSWVGC